MESARGTGGAWERKRAKARNTIQREALRLFRDQGFSATTVEQVAEAADVAPSTVFRYFPTKQDLLALADFHPLTAPFTEAFKAQPAELSALGAFRRAVVAGFADLSPDDRHERYERDLLMVTTPELWSANLGLVTSTMDVIAGLVAERTGRPHDDAEVRGLTRAACGVCLAVLLDWTQRGEPAADPVDALDEALSRLETGFSL